MRSRFTLLPLFSLAVALLVAAGWGWSQSAPASPAPAAAVDAKHAARAAEFGAEVKPLLQQFCYDCHADGADAGDLAIDAFQSTDDVLKSKDRWQKIIQYVRTQTMPPADSGALPTKAERDALVAALQRQLFLFDPANPDPGRVTMRRLNRTEYRNTVRDLVGVSFDPTIDFPQDDTGYGFDNIADVLSLPPMLMEKYLAAAERILDEAIPTEPAAPSVRRVAATSARPSFKPDKDRVRDGWVELSSRDEDALSVTGESPAPAEYVVRVLAYARHATPPDEGKMDPAPVKLSILRGDAVVSDLEVTAGEGKPQWVEARVGVDAGKYLFRAAVRRERGPEADRIVEAGRIGRQQAGTVFVKEIVIDGPVASHVRRINPDRMETAGTADRRGPSMALHRTDDQAIAVVDVPTDGEYLFRAQASADYCGDGPAKVEILLDGKPVRTLEIAAPSELKPSPLTKGLDDRARRAVPRVYDVPLNLKAGKRRLAVRFVNNLKEPEHPDPNYRDRNVYLQHFEFVDPAGSAASPPMTEPMRRLFAKHRPSGGRTPTTAPADVQTAAARALLADFTLRAWRRPPTSDEVDRLLELFALAREHGETYTASVKHAMKAVLVSPHFLFRGEIDAPPATPPVADGKIARPVGEYELATRLSYFLWSSTPDDELLTLAGKGELRKNLDAQVKRMLASPRSQALVDNFAGQWLQFRNLDAAHPDRKMFEVYDDRLREAMKRETHLFFESILRDGRSLLEILTADYTFVNERLAKHYGIPDVKGDEFRKVSLAGTPRRGVLTHGSVLTLTSNPTRTSPVKRGKWVLENLLGTPPPPPPPDIPALEADGQALTGTVRERLEKHREDPSCASCHAPMDPIGFALENFDAVGRWREKDGKDPIDASSVFPDGTEFTGPGELIEILAETRKDDFLRSLTENAMTFALGRGVEPIDQPAVDAILSQLARGEQDATFAALVSGVVNSVPFQMRRVDAGAAGDATAQASAD